MFLRGRSEQVEALKQVPLFGGLSQRHLSQIARMVDQVAVEQDRMLTRQSGLAREFLLILEGRARVERDGRLIARLGPGDFFGEMSLIDGKPRSAAVIAETPMALLVVDSRSFGGLLSAVPELQRKIMVALCERLRNADVAIAARN